MIASAKPLKLLELKYDSHISFRSRLHCALFIENEKSCKFILLTVFES